MKGNKLSTLFALLLLGALSSCGDVLKKSEDGAITVGIPKENGDDEANLS